MNGTALRRWHTYIGLLCAPSLIFMCLTGAVQLFSLHEAHDGYHPYAWVEELSSVHKDQVLQHHHEHKHEDAPAPAGAKAAAEPADADHDDDHDESASVATLALKVFFLLVSLGLTVSASFGIWIALTQSRQRKLCWVLLGSGTALPILFLILG
jgi:PepSY-associated TM region